MTHDSAIAAGDRTLHFPVHFISSYAQEDSVCQPAEKAGAGSR
jgi:hypothetical protein